MTSELERKIKAMREEIERHGTLVVTPTTDGMLLDALETCLHQRTSSIKTVAALIRQESSQVEELLEKCDTQILAALTGNGGRSAIKREGE